MGSPRSNLTAAQVSSRPLTALHEGCPEGKPVVYMLVQCSPLLVEKSGVSQDVTLRFTAHKQVRVQLKGSRKSKIGVISGTHNRPLSNKKN